MNTESQDKITRNKDTGNPLMRYVKSLGHALSGIGYAIKNEHNMIIMVIAAFIVCLGGLYFQIETAEWLFCIIIIGIIMGVEMINSSFEALVDLVTLERHPLAKIAKDCASSASLIFSFTAFVGALFIFLPRILELFIK